MIRRQRRGGGTLRLRLRRVWNQGRGLIVFSENSPQKEFQNFQLHNRWRNRSNKFLLPLNQPRTLSSSPSFPTEILLNSPPRRMETPLAAALAPLTCCVSPHLQSSTSAAHVPKVFPSSTVKLRCQVAVYPQTRVKREELPRGAG